jgi:Nucleotidyl transferase AbiEii toxin, Type IV TA system
MSRILKPKINILPAAQRKIWPELKGVTALSYVLYGGTAIALRLGHRASVDFDFFTDRALDRLALHAALPPLSGSTFLQDIRTRSRRLSRSDEQR